MWDAKKQPKHYGGMTFTEMLAILKRPLKRWMSEDDARSMGGWDQVDGWPRSAGDFAKPTKEDDSHDD